MSDFILGLDIGSFEIKATIAKFDGKIFSICGIGKAETTGIKRGTITNIEQASNAIKKAIAKATSSSGTTFNKAIVSISGAYTKYTKSTGIINVPANEIHINEIKRVMKMAENNANIPNDYMQLHILPYNFKVDEQDHIEDPLGMSGSRLEVSTHIITAPKSSIRNLEKSVQMAGVNIDNIVLSGYASAIATLSNEEKELGVCVVDMGSATCDIVVHIGNSLIHNDILPLGSANVTSDLSKALHIPLLNAEDIKINYGRLIENNCESIELPTVGEEHKRNKVDIEMIAKIMYARIEETLMYLERKIYSSKLIDKLGAGLVLTGGMAKLDDIREFTKSYFGGIPVRVARPRAVKGLYEISQDTVNSCSIGLCLYGAGEFTPYEIDSNGKLRYKDEILKFEKNSYENELQEALSGDDKSQDSGIILENNLKDKSSKSKKGNIFVRFWNKLKQSF